MTKLNPTGTALVYSTYLGGGANTNSGGAGIALDANGDAFVTGWTNSTVFPTKNPIQVNNGGGFDAFVTEVNPSGSGLLFSNYLGGSANDDGYAIALGVGPEHSYWKDTKRVHYTHVCDGDALEGFSLCSRLEGILPALDTAHAIVEAMRVAAKRSREDVVLVCLSGRGDKDCDEVARLMGEDIHD